MAQKNAQVVPGTDHALMVDEAEASVIEYMRGPNASAKRNISEQEMRRLIHKDAEVRASYQRKVLRLVGAMHVAGLTPAAFNRATLDYRNKTWSLSGNAGPVKA